MMRILAGAAFISAFAAPVLAFEFPWDVQMSEEDVFGVRNVVASVSGQTGGMHIRMECGSDWPQPVLALLFKWSDEGGFDGDSPLPAELV